MIDPAREATYRSLFGRGLAAPPLMPGVDLGFDLRLEAGPAGVRLAEAAGVANLAQALRLALTTPLGDIPFARDYGFDGLTALATETDPRLQRERIRIAVAQTVQRDPRVRRITDVQVVVDAATRTMAIDVSLDTTASEGLTVRLDGLPSRG